MKILVSIAATYETVYHGSPYSDVDFRFISKPIYVTTSRKVATDYAEGRIAFCGNHVSGTKSPTLYKLELEQNLMDFRNPIVRKRYEEQRRAYNAAQDDLDNLLPSLQSEGFIQSHTGLPGYGHAAGIWPLFKNYYYGMYVDEGPTHGISIAVWNPKALKLLSTIPL